MKLFTKICISIFITLSMTACETGSPRYKRTPTITFDASSATFYNKTKMQPENIVSQQGLIYGDQTLKIFPIPYKQLPNHFAKNTNIKAAYKARIASDAKLMTADEIENLTLSPRILLMTSEVTTKPAIEKWLFPEGNIIYFKYGKMLLGKYFQQDDKICFTSPDGQKDWCPYLFQAADGIYFSETRTPYYSQKWKFATHHEFSTNLQGDFIFSELKKKQGFDIAEYLSVNGTALPTQVAASSINYTAKPTIKVEQKVNDDIAVIIGNNNYRTKLSKIPNVDPAQADMRAIYKYFTKVKNISPENILQLNNATQGDLIKVFGTHRNHKGTAFNWIKPQKSNLYVYYVGHGAPSEDGGLLVPTDARFDSIDLNGYPVEQLLSNLSKIPSKSTTVILESCFSGISESGSLVSHASPVYLKNGATSIPNNINLITAAGPNQIASWQENKRSSLFTKYLLEGLYGAADGEGYGNGDGKISQFELQAYLNDTMTYQARRNYGRDQNSQVQFIDGFSF